MLIPKLGWIVALAAVVNAYAEPAEVAPASTCVVTVTRDAVSARFPVLENPTDTWVWQRKSTDDNAGEYTWQIRFANYAGPGSTPRDDYAHSLAVSIFKFPGMAERVGTFAELMLAAQGDLWGCDSTGSDCKREEGVRFTGTRESGYTLISVARDPGVDAVIASKPPGAELSGGTPEQTWYCQAIVQYK